MNPRNPTPIQAPMLLTHLDSMDVHLTAQNLLERSGYSVLRQVRCEFRDGALRLRGVLPSQNLKQFAQEVVSEVHGVREIHNEIEVLTPIGGEAAERFALLTV